MQHNYNSNISDNYNKLFVPSAQSRLVKLQGSELCRYMVQQGEVVLCLVSDCVYDNEEL